MVTVLLTIKNIQILGKREKYCYRQFMPFKISTLYSKNPFFTNVPYIPADIHSCHNL